VGLDVVCKIIVDKGSCIVKKCQIFLCGAVMLLANVTSSVTIFFCLELDECSMHKIVRIIHSGRLTLCLPGSSFPP
jgi:hypothetical protein